MNNFISQAFSGKSLLHGVLVAVYASVISGLYAILNNGGLPTLAQLKGIAIAATSVAMGYILKNGFNGSSAVSQPSNTNQI